MNLRKNGEQIVNFIIGEVIVIRAFIGIDFNTECKKNILDLQQRFRKYAVKGRWKHSDNFHLTLRFLDEINAEQQKQIDGVLKELCSRQPSFVLETSGPGIFPGRDGIRVLWLGLGGDLARLHLLSSEMDKSLAALGFPPEKRAYSPHITLGQEIRFECPFEEIRDRIGYQKFGLIQVHAIFLFKSEQVQNKRIYTRISEYALQ
jgi:2'-5' RNA ligase